MSSVTYQQLLAQSQNAQAGPFAMADLLTWPEPLAEFVARLARVGRVGIADLAAIAGLDEAAVTAVLEALADREILRRDVDGYHLNLILARNRRQTRSLRG